MGQVQEEGNTLYKQAYLEIFARTLLLFSVVRRVIILYNIPFPTTTS